MASGASLARAGGYYTGPRPGTGTVLPLFPAGWQPGVGPAVPAGLVLGRHSRPYAKEDPRRPSPRADVAETPRPALSRLARFGAGGSGNKSPVGVVANTRERIEDGMSNKKWVSTLWTRPPKLTPEETETLARRIDRYLPSAGLRNGANLADRRSKPRFNPRKSHVTLGWCDDGDFRLVGAQIIDISAGGAQVEADEAPPKGQTVWMRRDGALATEGRRGTVLESRWMLMKVKYAIRFVFEDELPLDMSEVQV